MYTSGIPCYVTIFIASITGAHRFKPFDIEYLSVTSQKIKFVKLWDLSR